MPRILKYKNGQVIVSGVEMTPDAMLMLDNGIPVDIELEILDGKKITPKQRRKVFALCNDIEEFTGQPREYMRQMFKDYLIFMNGYSEFSLSDCTRKQASELIDLILVWVFQNDIPLNYKTSDLLKNDRTFLYLATINRKCVICGAQNSDLAHRFTVGSGRNRNEIDHYGNQVLALCRNHHSEQHQIGMDSFNAKYHLEDSWVDVNDRLNDMLKGR
ncbi:putative HNHc nuclease [Macrococcus animalis]|uniref:putative HNHc nuclease n=1 Tax=Macrococcus animalis TaxID=3395467 RepID=UPI0039BE3F96